MKKFQALLQAYMKIAFLLFCLSFLESCQALSDKIADWTGRKSEILYTCPMPEDSVFSKEPGRCPKCGMELVLMNPEGEGHDHTEKEVYTCPMPEDSVFSDKPGTCPKCGMDLVKVENTPGVGGEITLENLLKPTHTYVVSSIGVTALQPGEESMESEAIGRIAYDTREAGSIASRVAGRIEKLYVRYRYQKVSKGQHILDMYSPELLTAQQNLLFLLQNDPENSMMIGAAKEKLLLLGMPEKQLNQVMQSGKAMLTIPVYSHYSGHIHEAGNTGPGMNAAETTMDNTPLQSTEGLSLKEGMYLQKGQTIFAVYNPGRAWAILNISGADAASVSVGDRVRLIPETAPDKDFRAEISFIEPFYATDSKTLQARVYFDNSKLKLPIGSQVRATIFGKASYGNWLPATSVLSLGMDKIVFIKTPQGFKAQKVETGREQHKRVLITGGLNVTDSVALNAQYLMDSESFIKVNN